MPSTPKAPLGVSQPPISNPASQGIAKLEVQATWVRVAQVASMISSSSPHCSHSPEGNK